MLNVVIYDRGSKFRVFHVDEATQQRSEVSASYRLGDISVVDKDGMRISGFFVGEVVGKAEEVDAAEAARRLRT